MLPRDAKPEDAPVPCACCGAKSETCVWQLDLCHGCHGRWRDEVVYPPCHNEAAVIEVVDGVRTVTFPTPTKTRLAEWARVTAEWLQRAKARAA